MKPADIARRRLNNQYLVTPVSNTATGIVSILGAVQSQDYAGAKWGIFQRAVGLSEAAIENEISTGRIIRTHVLRPTWHFVAAEDLRWMLELTAPRVHQANAFSYRYYEVDDAVVRKSRRALTAALQGGAHLTRDELTLAFKKAKIAVDNRQRIAHLMMRAELDGVVCSGARRGKQFTYSLLDARVPAGGTRDRDESLSELARRFFSTRGPATIDDFSWWSGLTKADSRRGVLAAGSSLVAEKTNSRFYYSGSDERPAMRPSNLAHLLPNYDEYFIGFKDRGAMLDRLRRKGQTPRTDALSGHVLTINGQMVGGWARSLTRKGTSVALRLVDDLTRPEQRAIEKAVTKFGEFLGTETRVS